MTTRLIISWAKLVLFVIVAVGSNWLPLEAKSPTLAESKPINQTQGFDAEEVLWLARAVRSETDRSTQGEMVKVACVIRNRVATNYRGAQTYKDVILDRGQFSGFSKLDANYKRNMSLGYSDAGAIWQDAIRVAELVYKDGSLVCDFPQTVRHFYSPVSAQNTPEWAKGKEPVLTIKDKTSTRFAFYSNIK
ncbi:MAG TPA: cell wall hydrolase [Candidatus Paceibacterota bacterium]